MTTKLFYGKLNCIHHDFKSNYLKTIHSYMSINFIYHLIISSLMEFPVICANACANSAMKKCCDSLYQYDVEYSVIYNIYFI